VPQAGSWMRKLQGCMRNIVLHVARKMMNPWESHILYSITVTKNFMDYTFLSNNVILKGQCVPKLYTDNFENIFWVKWCLATSIWRYFLYYAKYRLKTEGHIHL
jgi:hypothetical protein